MQDQISPETRGPETTFDPFVVQLHLRLQENGLLNPPLSSPQHGSHSANSEETPFSQEPRQTVSEPVRTAKLAQVGDDGSSKDDRLNVTETSAREQMREKGVTAISGCEEDREIGLREAIKGIYRLWKAQSGSEDASTFIDIVKDTLEI